MTVVSARDQRIAEVEAVRDQFAEKQVVRRFLQLQATVQKIRTREQAASRRERQDAARVAEAVQLVQSGRASWAQRIGLGAPEVGAPWLQTAHENQRVIESAFLDGVRHLTHQLGVSHD